MSKILNAILTIVLIILAIALISRLIIDIKIMVELEYPGNCIEINEEYYCKVERETKKSNIFVM